MQFLSVILVKSTLHLDAEIEQFFEKGVNLVVNFGKNELGFRSILVVNSEKNDNLF